MAHRIDCKCGRSYAVAATNAGSSFECLCHTTIEVPALSKLRHFEIVPDPENKTVEPLAFEKMNCENLKYVLARYMDAVDALKYTRSRSQFDTAINNDKLSPIEVDQLYSTIDRHIRRERRAFGLKSILGGIICIPVFGFLLIAALLDMRNVRSIAVIGFVLFSLIVVFLKGCHSFALSNMPNKP